MSIEKVAAQVTEVNERVGRAPYTLGKEALDDADMGGVIEHLQAALDGVTAILTRASDARHALITGRNEVAKAVPILSQAVGGSQNPHLQAAHSGMLALDTNSQAAMHSSAAMSRSASGARISIEATIESLRKVFTTAHETATTAAELCVAQQQLIIQETGAYLEEIRGQQQ